LQNIQWYQLIRKILKSRRDDITGHRIYEKKHTIQLHKIITLKFLGMTIVSKCYRYKLVEYSPNNQ